MLAADLFTLAAMTVGREHVSLWSDPLANYCKLAVASVPQRQDKTSKDTDLRVRKKVELNESEKGGGEGEERLGYVDTWIHASASAAGYVAQGAPHDRLLYCRLKF